MNIMKILKKVIYIEINKHKIVVRNQLILVNLKIKMIQFLKIPLQKEQDKNKIKI